MTNYQLQLNNHKTEMISIATKTVLNTDCSKSINLEGSDIKLANTVRILGVCLDPTLSSTANLLRCRICAIRHHLSEDVPKKTVACVCSFKTIIATHFWRAVLSIFFLNSQRYRKMLQDSFSKQPDPPRSLLCLSLIHI